MEQTQEHTFAAPAIARRRITEASHRRFAAFSGDLNPLHVDAEAARAMEPGGLLVYGMDLLLWSLETLAETGRLPANTARVRARFLKWVFLDDEVELNSIEGTRASIDRFEVAVNGTAVMTLELFAGERPLCSEARSAPAVPERQNEPRHTPIEALAGQAGWVLLVSAAEAATLYPALTARFGAAPLCELAGCSYVIGMEAPGLYSMSVRYDFAFCRAAEVAPALHYRVTAVDPRFRTVTLAVTGAHISGTLEALVRKA